MPQRPKLLRATSLTTGLPMAVFLLVAMYGLIRALQVDAAAEGIPEQEQLTEAPPESDDDTPGPRGRD